jgi:hypothetical protein
MIGGRLVGVSTYPTYLSVDHQWISLAMIDEADAQVGDEVTVIWGEPDGGSAKPGVERHVQKGNQARILPWPYLEAARKIAPHRVMPARRFFPPQPQGKTSDVSGMTAKTRALERVGFTRKQENPPGSSGERSMTALIAAMARSATSNGPAATWWETPRFPHGIP